MSNDTISKDRCKELLKQLESAFNARIPEVRLIHLWDQLKGFTDRQVVKGLAYLINHKPFLPPNNEIIQACQIERERDYEGQKAIDRRKEEAFFDKNKSRTQLGRDSIECIQKLLSENSMEKKIALVKDLHEKYPGVGFGAVISAWEKREGEKDAVL